MSFTYSYRPEIDGFRALAIAAGILFHAKFEFFGVDPFEGCYVGVEVFFVISGYLITSIILKGFADGSFSFLNFYERRIRRLLPLLLTVMVSTLPFAWWLLLPGEMLSFANSVLGTLFFVSNFWFWTDVQGYWATSSTLKPFLHTWSLGLEEQFYAITPLLLFLVWTYARSFLFRFVVALGMGSLLFADLALGWSEDFVFYLLPARLWELLAGSMLAVVEKREGTRQSKPGPKDFYPGLGMLMIFISMATFDANTPHPSLLTLLPVVGAMLVIRYARKGEPVTDFLSTKGLVYVGLISYGLYLWHYPVFAFWRIAFENPGNIEKVIWIAISFALAIPFYYLVESPFRRRIDGKYLTLYLFVLFVIIVGFCLGAIYSRGYSFRLPPVLGSDLEQKPWTINTDGEGLPCFGNRRFCEFRAPGAKGEVLLVGDSTLESIAPYLKPRVHSLGYDLITMNSSACYFAPGFYSSRGDGSPREIPNEPCDEAYQNARMQALLTRENSVVVLGGMLDKLLAPDCTECLSSKKGVPIADSYRASVAALLDRGHTVIQLAPFLTAARPVSRAIFKYSNRKSITTKSELIELLAIPEAAYLKRTATVRILLRSIQHENFHLVYPHKLFCDTLRSKTCVFNDGEEVYTVDTDHPARKGSIMISDLIVREIQALSAGSSPR